MVEVTRTGPIEKLVWAPTKDPENERQEILDRGILCLITPVGQHPFFKEIGPEKVVLALQYLAKITLHRIPSIDEAGLPDKITFTSVAPPESLDQSILPFTERKLTGVDQKNFSEIALIRLHPHWKYFPYLERHHLRLFPSNRPLFD